MSWIVLVLTACGTPAPEATPTPPPESVDGQSYTDGVTALCNAWQTCPNCRDSEPQDAAFNLNRHVEKVVTNAEVIGMFWAWSNFERPKRAEQLQTAVTRAGLDRCHLAIMFKDVRQGQP